MIDLKKSEKMLKRIEIGGRWNYKTHRYDPYTVPIEWDVRLYSEDMDEIVSCASCGKKVKYGDCYTSFEIHTEILGLGYSVCPECKEKEWARKQKYEGDKIWQ